MGFFENIADFISGKTKEERESDTLAKKIARRKLQKKEFEERVRQKERLIEEKEKIKVDREIERLNMRSKSNHRDFFKSDMDIMGYGKTNSNKIKII